MNDPSVAESGTAGFFMRADRAWLGEGVRHGCAASRTVGGHSKKAITASRAGTSGRWREQETGSRIRIGVRFGDCRKDFQTLRRCMMFTATLQYAMVIAEWLGQVLGNAVGF